MWICYQAVYICDIGVYIRFRITDTVVLQQANTFSIEMILIRNQIGRWVGHLARLLDDRLPKQLFYGEWQRGKRRRHKPKKRFRDAVKSNLKALNVKVEGWEQMRQDRTVWKQMIYNKCKAFEARRIEQSVLKRALRRQHLTTIPNTFLLKNICKICSRLDGSCERIELAFVWLSAVGVRYLIHIEALIISFKLTTILVLLHKLSFIDYSIHIGTFHRTDLKKKKKHIEISSRDLIDNRH
ncbi:Hypothetical predicted protein [Octopus vulgaris]|uniref:Uncharacterized protein n=1 Tax=Octopus vulgaris TaxID=6645 RepID=A0AA36BSC1_OCTVU|nr:Hypothetical predicted protein [Octopus vulgaris]